MKHISIKSVQFSPSDLTRKLDDVASISQFVGGMEGMEEIF